MYPGETICRVVALKRAGLKKNKKERRKFVVCKQIRLGNRCRVETSNANPFCWATAESLSTVSATTDSYGAGEAVASNIGAGEREGTGDGVEQKCTRAETGPTSH